jgi:hypothetical protein
MASERVVPSWMTAAAAAEKVTMDVVAGFNPNNSNSSFNGYYEGNTRAVLGVAHPPAADYPDLGACQR